MRFPEEPAASAFLALPSQIFLVLFLFLGLLFRVNELTLFCLIVLIVGTGTYFWSRMSIDAVNCLIFTDKTRMFPGEDLQLTIQTLNTRFLPVLIKIKLPLDRSLVGPGNDDLISEEFGLLWYQRLNFKKDFTPQKRGVYRVGPPFLRVGDIFGFFPREKDGTGDHEIIVYPRIVNVKPVDLPRREFFGIPGAKSPVEDPIFIYGTREYQPGSPARRIHWKASARHNRLQEKLCEPAEQEKIFIVLDVDQFEEENAFDAFERILEIAASMVLQYNQQGYSVGFVTNGQIVGKGSKIISISRSPLHISLILELLARLQAHREETIPDILKRGYELPWGVSCLHLSYDLGNATSATEAYFRERKVPVRFIHSKNMTTLINENDLTESGITGPDNTLVSEDIGK